MKDKHRAECAPGESARRKDAGTEYRRENPRSVRPCLCAVCNRLGHQTGVRPALWE